MAARALRNAGYGWLSVALALVLTERGYPAAAIGVILAVALATGATFSAAAGLLARRFGIRRTLVGGSLLMAASGVMLAQGSWWWTCAAVVLGTVSAGTQEVGPFTALEQTMLSHTARDTGHTTSILGRYNVVGAFAVAVGASLAAVIPSGGALWGYAGLGLALAALYRSLPESVTPPIQPEEAAHSAHVPNAVEKLAILFAFDAFGGGILVQSFIAYWFVVKFGADARQIGILFFVANMLGAVSLLFAAPVSRRIGLVRTMVYAHFPSNVFLLLIPFMPNLETAAAALCVRSLLSQMDVPVRQSLVMAIVPLHDRARAVGITNAVRPAASALGPLISGIAVGAAAMSLPFLLSGGIKAAYDLTLFAQFHDVDEKLKAGGS